MHLPIDPYLPRISERVASDGGLVLTAAPGAGKSTRVPPALLAALDGDILLLQPRRAAARHVAARIASERGEALGATIGYQIRRDKKGSARTRLWVITEGILTRRLLHDPYLEGVGCVILDEFHERSLHSDLACGWIRELQRSVRPDLRLLVMSATMDAQRVADFLKLPAPVEVPGEVHPVATTHFPAQQRERLGDHVLRAVRTALKHDDHGTILVFLPGMGEIRTCLSLLPQITDLPVLPLHSSVPQDQQSRALDPATGERIICATTIAETSLTIPDVRTVIDSGLVRSPTVDADSGIEELRLEPISIFSADQRRGRAGRTGPGRCWRLWSQLDHARRSDAGLPDVQRVDLAPWLLTMKAWHGPDPRAFPWFEAPDAERLQAGEQLLADLGLCERAYGAITDLGSELAQLPLHPRLARLLHDARAAGVAELGAALAALGQERDVRPRDHAVAPGGDDVVDRLDCLAGAEPADFGARRDCRQLARELGGDVDAAGLQAMQKPELLPRLLLSAWPDRVARRSAPGSNRVRRVGGGGVEIAAGSAQHLPAGKREQGLLLLVDIHARRSRGQTRVESRIAIPVSEEDLAAVHPHACIEERRLSYHAQADRVEAQRVWRFGDLVLRTAQDEDADPGEVAACLAEHLLPACDALIAEDAEAGAWLARYRWLQVRQPHLPPWDDAARSAVLTQLCSGKRTRKQVGGQPILPWLHNWLAEAREYSAIAAVDEAAPATIDLPKNRTRRLRYEDPEGPPVLRTKLQDCFGMDAHPTAGGEAVQCELLAPNGRPCQITTDLPGFWRGSYQLVRKDLRGRYPKHAWPEDPLV